MNTPNEATTRAHRRATAERARRALADTQQLDMSDAHAVAHMLGRLTVLVEELLDTVDGQRDD